MYTYIYARGRGTPRNTNNNNNNSIVHRIHRYYIMCMSYLLSGRRSHIVFAPDALLPSYAHDNTIHPPGPRGRELSASRHVFADKIQN